MKKKHLGAAQSVDRFSTLQVILEGQMSRLGWSAQPKKKCDTEPDSTYFGEYFKLMAKNRLLSILIS